MTKPHLEKIEQVFFSWSHDGPGLTVFAHSFTDPADAKRWQHRLSPHLRLQPMAGAEPPETALSYLDFDNGYAAVLRRVDKGYSAGRNNSHALIGSVEVLSAPVALGLSSWSGWWDRANGQQMPSYHAADFGQFADNAERLYVSARRTEQAIHTVLARLLDEPTAPMSVIGCPEKDRLALIWGLRLAAEEHLCHLGTRRHWTFSTYENRHDVSADNLPEIVFLPANQTGASMVRRTIVDLQRPSETTHASWENAGRLLDIAFRDAKGPLPAATHRPPVEPQETQEIQRPTQPKPPQDNTPAMTPPPSQPAPAAQPAPAHQTGQPHPAKALARATTMREFETLLGQLEALAQFPDNRKVTRNALNHSTLSSITCLVEDKARQDLYVRLIKAAYGQKAEDLQGPDAVQHAADVIRSSQSDVLARLVGQAGATAGNGRLGEVGLARWFAGGQPVPPAAGRWFDGLFAERRFPRLWLVVAVAMVTMLVVVFLLGVQVGKPDTASASPTTTSAPPTTTSAPPGTTAAPPATAVAAKVFRVRDDPPKTADKSVVAFLRDGETHYPQGLCEKGDDGTWQCRTNGTHRTAPGEPTVEIARAVPVKELPDLMRKAVHGTDARPTREWTDPLPPL